MDYKTDIFNYGQNVSITELETLLQKASDAYYNTGNTIMSDSQFDILVEFLQKRSPKSKFLKQVGAPTKNLDVKLDYYLGSMDKIKPPTNKIDIWTKKYKAPYYLSDKLDGVSGLIIYNNNKITLHTRGTATQGKDITKLIKYLNLPEYSIISKLKEFGVKNKLALRGELIISKKNFTKHSKVFKNARNLVAGLVNSKTRNPIISKDLEFIVYNILDPIMTFYEQMKLSKKLGFNTVYYQKETEITIPVLSSILKQRKSNSKFEIDGIIITDNISRPLQVGRNPEYAFAYKELLDDNIKDAIVKDIEWNISKSGKIIPVVIIKPIDLGGVTISRVSANNAKYIKDNNIGKNTKIKITRSGDVIPYIVEITKKTKALFPKYDFKWSNTKVDIIAVNNTPEQDIKKIYFFFKTLDAKGFGLKLIEKLYKSKFNTIQKILNMKIKDFLTVENVKEKSANNFFNELQTLKNKSHNIEKLILATNSLGENFGSRKAKLIFDNYPNILKEKLYKNKKVWLEKLITIDGIEEKTANQIIDNWKDLQLNLKWIKKYFKINSIKKTSKTNLVNINWVLTGFRDKDIENKIINLGGKVSNSISKNTHILVVKDSTVIDNPTSKVNKAKELGIKIIQKKDVDKFLK